MSRYVGLDTGLFRAGLRLLLAIGILAACIAPCGILIHKLSSLELENKRECYRVGTSRPKSAIKSYHQAIKNHTKEGQKYLLRRNFLTDVKSTSNISIMFSKQGGM